MRTRDGDGRGGRGGRGLRRVSGDDDFAEEEMRDRIREELEVRPEPVPQVPVHQQEPAEQVRAPVQGRRPRAPQLGAGPSPQAPG